MRTSGSIKHDERTGGAGQRSRWDRIRHHHPVALSAMAASAWALLIAVFASASRLSGPEAERGTWSDVLGAVIGNFVVVFVIALAITVIVSASSRRQAGAVAPRNGWAPPEIRTSTESARDHPLARQEPFRIAKGGAFGALPGLFVAVVPLLLHEADMISSDQSQIGFIGVPLVFIGTLAGILAAVRESRSVTRVLLGAGAGFIVGVVAASLLAAFGTGIPGVVLVLTPACMITGAAFASYVALRRTATMKTRR